MKKFYQLGKYYFAIHCTTNEVFMCIDTPGEIEATVQKGAEFVKNVESYQQKIEIDAALFVSRFSGVVNKLHSQTPYA